MAAVLVDNIVHRYRLAGNCNGSLALLTLINNKKNTNIPFKFNIFVMFQLILSGIMWLKITIQKFVSFKKVNIRLIFEIFLPSNSFFFIKNFCFIFYFIWKFIDIFVVDRRRRECIFPSNLNCQFSEVNPKSFFLFFCCW